MSVAWVLNLDADLELAAGRGYAPTRAVLAAMEPHRQRLARLLVREGDVALDDGAAITPRAEGRRSGRAFCPTPRALEIMRRAGIEPEDHPSFDVLRLVNGRAFCAELGQTLAGALFATSLDEALSVIRGSPPVGHQWRAKRAFGMAGRGQRPIAPAAPSDADIAFLRTSIERDGGIQLEPEVEIVRELGLHGFMTRDAQLRLGRLVEQRCDASGQWLETVALDGPENRRVQDELRAEAERVASALDRAGYFGPFGVDAFEYRDGSELRFNPRSEINARYSMGYPSSGLP